MINIVLYNLTQINGSGYVALMGSVNNILLFHQLGNLILLSLFIILIMSFIKNGNSIKFSLAAASFVTFIICSFLRIINLVNDLTFYICTFAFATFIMLLFFRES